MSATVPVKTGFSNFAGTSSISTQRLSSTQDLSQDLWLEFKIPFIFNSILAKMELQLEQEEVMKKLIRGEITEDSMAELKKLHPKKNLMIFVSSTFADTFLERNILHKNILPALQKRAKGHDIQIVFYDMRFGVKDENTLDHMTWGVCKEAIQQCHEGSDGLFFLSLQADRYGYQALPKYMDEDIIRNTRTDHVKNLEFPELKTVLDEWYILDKNQCSPRYELKKLVVNVNDRKYKDTVLPFLRDKILDLCAFEKLENIREELLVNQSVTEWETLFAFNCDRTAITRCFWVERTFGHDALLAFSNSLSYPTLVDIFRPSSTLPKCEALKATMKKHLKREQYVEVDSAISPEDYYEQNGSCQVYLNEWEKLLQGRLEKELNNVIGKLQCWNTEKSGIPADFQEEIIHHCTMAFTKARNFYGREDVINTAMNVLASRSSLEQINKGEEKYIPPNKRKTSGSTNAVGVDLALIGKSGCGKTSLMAKLALTAFQPNRTVPVIIRFCGTSKFSLKGLKLIQSICIQVLAAHRKLAELRNFLDRIPSQDYKTAVVSFHSFLVEYPVFLFIDSLDQLENRNEERSKLSFLRGIHPHQKSRIIVSSLPDEYDEDQKPGKYFYQCERTLKTAQVAILEVGMMDKGESIVECLLDKREMQLNNKQWITALKAVDREPTILYINLAMEVISQWRSFEKEVILRPTVKGLIHQIFGDLELSYGEKFVSTAFAMITFSREGVSDVELKDLLSLHKGVMEEVCQYSKLHCFPMHAWLRLKQMIKNLVTEKENHCIKWYHRQLRETASGRYLEKEKEYHEIMGKYFADIYGDPLKKEKDIMTQPRILYGASLWMSESIVNRRRAVEGYYHLIKGGLFRAAAKEMCSLEFVCCSALAGDLSNCVRYLEELVQSFEQVRLFGSYNEMREHLNHYYRWISKKATKIVVDPRRQTRMTAGEEPLTSVVKKQISQLEEGERNKLGYTLEPITFGVEEDLDALEMELAGNGHTKKVGAVAWNHDESKIVSGSYDKTIKIWNGKTGELLETLEGHPKGVVSVSWNHDSSKILSGSEDGTINIWNGMTFGWLMTLKAGASLYSVSWNHDCSRISSASSSDDIHGIRLRTWNAVTGDVPFPDLLLNSKKIGCVSWNHDGSQLLSGTQENNIKIWNAFTGELWKTLKGHTDLVTSASWNHDNTRVVSGSAGRDCTIKIWDVVTGVLLHTWKGHSHQIDSVVWNRDSSKILSGSWDKTIIIWNAETEELVGFVAETSNNSLAWSQDESRIVSGSRHGTVQVWKGWKTQTRKKLSSRTLSSLSNWNPVDNQRILSGYEDGTIRVWNGVNGELLNTWGGHSDKVTSIVWNHGGTRIASGSKDKTVKIWDGVTYELLMTLEGHSDPIDRISWNSDDSRIISVSNDDRDDQFFLWKCLESSWSNSSSAKLKRLGGVINISWNPDNYKVFIGFFQREIVILDGNTLEETGWFCICNTVDSDPVDSVSWNRNCTQIISGSRNEIQIWRSPFFTTSVREYCKDMERNGAALLDILSGHVDKIRSVFWNQDQSKIFSGSDDGTIRIWDGKSSGKNTTQLLKTETVGSRVRSLRLSKGEDRIAFRCKDNFIRCMATPKLPQKSSIKSQQQKPKPKISQD
jgi:WD40 repeat protein